ncbi:HAD-IA family hydrolase [Brachybacterium sp. GCM10030267]|uniref:HAD-IA family hydrolase n=1 Tax=unclassified Brachybacterium TaxID=2623841 RepID=UPI00360B6CCD
MRAVIWDLGGTLVDTYPDVDRALASAVHSEVDDAALREVARLTRVSSSHAIATLAERHGVSERRLRVAYEATKQHWLNHPPAVMEGAPEVIEAVRRAGGMNLVATHRERSSAQALLDALELRIDDMVCAPDGFERKPDPAMIRELLSRHDLDPGECLAIGDRPADVEAAAAAGVRSVLLETPGVPMPAGSAPRITRVDELPGLLGL